MQSRVSKAIQEAYPVPGHIQAIANAVRYDLLHGPSWLLVPDGDVTKVRHDCMATLRDDLNDDSDVNESDLIEETYTGIAAQALRDYIDDLPSTVYVDTDCGFVSDREPEGQWISPDDLGLDPYDPDEDDKQGYEWNSDYSMVWDEPCMDNTYHCDRSDIIEALFGRTIAREFR